jgi:hypothetical protein
MSYLDCSDDIIRTKVEEIIQNLSRGINVSNELKIKNLLYYEGYVDLMIAFCLGHKYNIETQGADAIDSDGKLVEYKCIVKKDMGYTGSFQFHWLSKNKISKYSECAHFYFAWRDGFTIEKIIKVETSILMPAIIAKASVDGTTAGHKSFSAQYIENLLECSNASIIYKLNK